ncbi:MAG: hypothetical protein CMJ83_06180 [Planctomycetes bacterium]|nr:hypothetical protein [Planctomycetota bacterium]
MLDHPDPKDLTAHHDGELPPEAAKDVRKHLERCASCAQEAAKLAEITRLMTAQTLVMPAGLRSRIEGAAARRSEVRAQRWWPRVAAAAAGAIALLGVASLALPDHGEETGTRGSRANSSASPLVEVLLARSTASEIAQDASTAPLTRRREEIVLAQVMARGRSGR